MAAEDFTEAAERFTAEATPGTVAVVTTEAIVGADTTVIAVAMGTVGVADIGVTRATVTDGEGDLDMVGVGRFGGDTRTRTATAWVGELPTLTIIRPLVHLAMPVQMMETATTILRRRILIQDPAAAILQELGDLPCRTALPTRTTRRAAKHPSQMLRFSRLTG